MLWELEITKKALGVLDIDLLVTRPIYNADDYLQGGGGGWKQKKNLHCAGTHKPCQMMRIWNSFSLLVNHIFVIWNSCVCASKQGLWIFVWHTIFRKSMFISFFPLNEFLSGFVNASGGAYCKPLLKRYINVLFH